MKVEYYPKRELNQDIIRDTGYAVLLPDTMPARPKLMIAIHGHGERSSGTIKNLENLVLGFDYNGDGKREGAAFLTDDMKKAVDQEGIVMITPTYESSMNVLSVNKIDALYLWAVERFKTHEKMLLTGFSGGGGSALGFAISSAANAAKCAYVVLCGSINVSGDKSIPGKMNLPVHAFHNDEDNRVGVKSTRDIVSQLNANNSGMKALMTIFRKDGHGGNVEAWSLTPPKAPGGEGFTDAAENIYQVFTDIIKTGVPRQMRSGTAQPMPTPPPLPEAPAGVTPITSYTIDSSGIHLRGDKSIGYKSGMDGKWEFVSGPAGTNVRTVFPNGSTYINADGKLPVPGTYVFRFILKGATAVDVTVVHGVVEKKPVRFEGTGTLTYSDQSTDTITITFIDGKLVVKNSAGTVINI